VSLVAGFMPGETITLRPGLEVPDWSCVTEPTARRALVDSMAVSERRTRWASLDAAEDAVRRAVLRHLVSQDAWPAIADLADATGRDAMEVRNLLRRLRQRDLLVLDPTEQNVLASYPFSARATPHRVWLAEATLPVHALCAIDALGAGAMLSVASRITSSCAHCGTQIAVRTSDNGRSLACSAPGMAVVWSGIRYSGGCAATSGCLLKIFFCGDAHLEAWRREVDPHGAGHRLTLQQALEVGRALFGPMLQGTA
jgi:hypothetical protein